MFEETETAKAMREIVHRDPSFNFEKFMKQAHEFIIPEILDAFLTADYHSLRQWCSEAVMHHVVQNFVTCLCN